MRAPRHHLGFSLLELSIVLVLIAMLISGGMVAFANSLDQRQYQDTLKRMKIIEDALRNYALAGRALPCPAQPTLSDSHVNMGVSWHGGTACNTGMAGTSNRSIGLVPFKALGLPIDFAYDGYGRRMMYAVHDVAAQTTSTTPFDTYGPGSTSIGNITIKNAAGQDITTNAVYALISFGKNGHGAYSRDGASRRSYGSTNADEQTNCFCNSSAVTAGSPTLGTFIQKQPEQVSGSPLAGFDDIVVFKRRADLVAPYEQ